MTSPGDQEPMTTTTLDPLDWEAFRRLAHTMVDDMTTHLQTIGDRPAWRPLPAAVRDNLREPPPQAGQPDEVIYEQFKELILPFPYGNTHPRFWGWVAGAGTPIGMLADLLAAGMNSTLNGFQQAPEAVESQVIEWMTELMDFPRGTSGLLVTGGSMANFIALAAARNNKADFDVNARGLHRSDQQLMFYLSEQTHSCVKKALQLLGIGTQAVRTFACDTDVRIDMAAAMRAVRSDRRDGHRPCGIIANAGTVDQGAFDDLNAVADLAKQYDLWMHVDGAFGATVKISRTHRHRADGLERADSMAIDFHKWWSVPYGAACVLIRNPDAHRAPFSFDADYFSALEGGVADAEPRFADLGPELSREFRALKVWMTIKSAGIERLADCVDRNIEQAQYLVRRIDDHPRLERLGPAPLNVVCFRYTAPRLDDRQLDKLNRQLLIAMQSSGVAVPSHTICNGRFALRVAIVNHRTTMRDLDVFLEAIEELGDELVSARRDADVMPI